MPPTPPKPVIVDVDNTLTAVASLAHNTFSVMEGQRMALGRLQEVCNAAKAGENCYSVATDVGGTSNNKEALTYATIGHAFTDNFSAGVSLSHSFWRDLPDNFGHSDANVGGGLYAQWRGETATGSWYLRGSAAANRYDLKRTREVLGYTEAGNGDSQ